MNDLLLECFRAATETLNFTVAAQKIHMSQPAFSRNIAALEEEVGFKLFWRSKQNGSRLTPAGAALYNGLFEIEQQYNDLLEKAKQISRGEAGSLVIGVLGGVCLDSKSFQHVTMFRERYPQVEVEMKSCTMKGLEEDLLKGSCDISFIMADVLRHREEILFEKVFTVESFFMVPKSSNFTQDETYSLADLKDETFILSEEFPEINDGMIKLCRSCGFEPKIKMAPDYETKMLWADMGMGVTGNTRDHYTRNSRNAEFIRIRELASMDFSLAWSKENYNPAIALFYSLIEEVTNAE